MDNRKTEEDKQASGEKGNSRTLACCGRLTLADTEVLSSRKNPGERNESMMRQGGIGRQRITLGLEECRNIERQARCGRQRRMLRNEDSRKTER